MNDQKIEKVIELLENKKCEDIKVFDIRKQSAFTDFIIIATVNSTTQGKAVLKEFKDNLGFKPHHSEGEAGGEWVLIDFIDFIVNIFLPETRDFYSLERIWGESERTSE